MAAEPNRVRDEFTKATYEKRKGTTGALKGPNYEKNIIMMIIQRCSEENLAFKIQSNTTSIEECFDDIVAEFTGNTELGGETSKYMFLQAKCLAGKKASIFSDKIKGNKCLSDKNQIFAFNIRKWFDSFVTISEQCVGNNFELMYFTTADIEDHWKDNFITCDSIFSDILLPQPEEGIADYEGKIYALNFEKCVEVLKEQCNGETKIKNFCTKFRIFALQPDNKTLESIIKDEMKIQNPVTTERIYKTASSILNEWWSLTGEVTVLNTDVFVRAECEEMFLLPEKENPDFHFIENETSVLNLNSKYTTLICKTTDFSVYIDLLKQRLADNKKYLFTMKEFSERQENLIACLKNLKSPTYIILKIDDFIAKDVATTRRVLTSLVSLSEDLTHLRLVFLIAQSAVSEELIPDNFPSTHHRDLLSYSSLSESTKERVLAYEINFIGQEINLLTLNFPAESLEKFIDEETLADIRANNKIVIGEASSYSNFDSKTYIPRKLNLLKIRNPRELLVSKDIKDYYFIIALPEEKEIAFKEWGLGTSSESEQISSNITFLSTENTKKFQETCQRVKEKNVILLKIVNSQNVIWLKSSKENIKDIFQFCERNISEEDLIAEIIKPLFPTVSIVPHDAGMGKTSLAYSMQRQLISLNYWALLVPLSSYLNAPVKNVKILGHTMTSQELIGKFLPRNQYFQKLVNNDRVIVLLDGLDEVAPKHTQTVLDVIDALCNMGVYRVIVLTRSHLANEVMSSKSALTIELQKFDRQDVADFMRQYYKSDDSLQASSRHDRLEYFISRLVGVIFSKERQYWTETTGVPLQARMIAEVFRERCKEYLDTESPTSLPSENDTNKDFYLEFIDEKYQIYWVVKKNTPPSIIEDHSAILREQFDKSHLCCANELIFRETDVFEHWNSKYRTVRDSHTIINYGIIRHLDKKNIEFIHRSFAEYFCAMFIARVLFKKVSVQQLNFIYNSILIEDQYKLIRKFVNQIFGTIEDSVDAFQGIHDEISDVFNVVGYSAILYVALFENNAHLARKLLTCAGTKWPDTARNALVNYRENGGQSPLHRAAEGGHTEVVRLLLEQGADRVNRDIRGWTPLHVAAYHGQFHVVRQLSKAGCDLNVRDYSGESPLHEAAAHGNVECIRVLVELGAKVNAGDNMGFTPLHRAAAHGNVECIRVLVELGAQVNVIEKGGFTPLHKAVLMNKIDCARVLLDAGADINARNKLGWTPLTASRNLGKTELAAFLQSRGATE